MRKTLPSIPIRITGIIRTTEDGVLIRLPSGRTRWIPRAHAGFSPGYVILPPWLATKIKNENKPKEHSQS